MIQPILFTVLASGALFVSAALSQDAEYKGLTARELCLKPPKPAAAPAKPATTPPATPKQAQTKPKDPAPVVLAAYTESDVPLGLRYKLRKRVDGEWEDTNPDTVFRAGDRIRLAITPYDDGYLYVVQRGSSDRWEVLFPNEAQGDIHNHVRRQQTITKQFYFDQTAGEEKLFLVYTRKPQQDLEELIHKLSTREAQPKKSAPPAVTTPKKQQEPLPLLMAQNRPTLDDALVSRLRSSLQSRDLVFEKVDDEKGEEKEKAVYVAVPSRSPEAAIIADLTLKHR